MQSNVSWLRDRIHKDLLERREQLRNDLEKAGIQHVPDLQGRIREVKRMLDDTFPAIFKDFYQHDEDEDE